MPSPSQSLAPPSDLSLHWTPAAIPARFLPCGAYPRRTTGVQVSSPALSGPFPFTFGLGKWRGRGGTPRRQPGGSRAAQTPTSGFSDGTGERGDSPLFVWSGRTRRTEEPPTVPFSTCSHSADSTEAIFRCRHRQPAGLFFCAERRARGARVGGRWVKEDCKKGGCKRKGGERKKN